MSSHITAEELAQHNKQDDLWIAVHGRVFDVTKFAAEHPGGKKVLFNVGGKDATAQFDQFHKKETLLKYGPQLYVGKLAAAEHIKEMREQREPASAKPMELALSPEAFGEQIPYGDPAWYQDWNSPYYKDSHRKYRAAVREFVEKEVIPYCHDWDEAKSLPKELYLKCAQAGILPGVVGAPWPTHFVPEVKLPGGIKPEEFDQFHELILTDEIARCGSGGVMWGVSGGLSIGLPPILNYGSTQLKDRVAGPCLRGEKIICLAITEPSAGSDVANLKSEAKLTPDGKHYVVNGEKKWITNGVFADYFTVAVRTGGRGMSGVSLLLIERNFPGVKTTQMKCSGVWPSGTTYITFEDVQVPVENLIGKENHGFRYIMANFNHERWGLAASALRFSRVCLEESIRYAHKRKTFGQRLIDHPVIRFKMGQMARQIEATQAWIEYITYQMCTMNKREQAERLGGPTALLKAQCTQIFEFCAREASQIFGGLAYTRGGQGEKIERLYREVRAYAIPGGSEEIMIDLGIRQAMRRSKL